MQFSEPTEKNVSRSLSPHTGINEAANVVMSKHYKHNQISMVFMVYTCKNKQMTTTITQRPLWLPSEHMLVRKQRLVTTSTALRCRSGLSNKRALAKGSLGSETGTRDRALPPTRSHVLTFQDACKESASLIFPQRRYTDSRVNKLVRDGWMDGWMDT